MAPCRRRLRLCLLLAAGLCALSGCFGVTQNPSYFPWLLPAGDIIQTHAKPLGAGYYANFDPHAVRLEVRPFPQTNPVRTQLVVIATVYDDTGKPRRARRVEWMVEGVGNIVEVDESGCFPGRGYKVDPKYAVSYTNYTEHRITRGTPEPADDFVVRPGQTWCVISSAVEGETYVTAYAPGIANWEKSRVFVTYHWVDAGWEFPLPGSERAGAEHVFTTHVFRHTDKQPLANYRVRYKILDGPPAVLLPSRTQEAVVISDLSGNANVGIGQLGPQLGVNRVSVEIIRPPDPTAPSGSGIVLAQGETSVEWLAPAVALTHEGPPAVGVGQEVVYTTRIANKGKIESRSMTVVAPLPDGLRYVRSVPPAVPDGKQLVWTLGLLPPGQVHTVQAFYQAGPAGTVTSCVSVVTEEGQRDQACVKTIITQPQLKLTLSAPPTGVVGAPVSYQITVTNPGTGPATNVKLTAVFDKGLKHESPAQTVTLDFGTLGPGETKSATPPLVLTPQQPGPLRTTVTATADGGLTDKQEHVLTAQQPRLGVSLAGPRTKYADRRVEWNIHVRNPSDVPLANVVVRDRLPPELLYEGATQGGVFNNGEVVWTLNGIGANSEKILQVTTRTAKAPGKTLHSVTATADPNLRATDEKPLEILGLAALRLEAVDIGDPAEVGKQVTYQVEVTNTGSLPANQVEIKAYIPDEMKVLAAPGPSLFTLDKNVVTFAKVDALPAGKSLRYTIEVQALKAGDVRFRVELRSLALQAPVMEEESTTIVDPTLPLGGVPAPAAPPPAGNPPPPPPRPPGGAGAALPASAPVVPAVPPPRLPAAPLP
jgi:uncharacterized repeat protein (TIGR01451 family)